MKAKIKEEVCPLRYIDKVITFEKTTIKALSGIEVYKVVNEDLWFSKNMLNIIDVEEIIITEIRELLYAIKENIMFTSEVPTKNQDMQVIPLQYISEELSYLVKSLKDLKNIDIDI